jgi:hypothetical protein
MNIGTLHETLNSISDPHTARREIILYLKKIIEDLGGRNDMSEIAYDIASLLSTDYARSLKHSDQLDVILTLAGELEAAGPVIIGQRWTELRRLIMAL